MPAIAYGFSFCAEKMAPTSSKTGIQLTWEPDAAAEVVKAAQVAEASHQTPFMVALVGIPGSGKSTSCEMLAEQLEAKGLSTMIMPFDGYHLPLNMLRQLPNANDKIYRRGAPDTFDPIGLKRDLMRIRCGDEPTVSLPGFAHEKGDPESGIHTFHRDQHSVVICEGLYLLHQDNGWDLQDCFDYSIFIDTDVDKSMSRLKTRNTCIPGYTPDEIRIRVDEVDRINALTVNASRERARLCVQSSFL